MFLWAHHTCLMRKWTEREIIVGVAQNRILVLYLFQTWQFTLLQQQDLSTTAKCAIRKNMQLKKY